MGAARKVCDVTFSPIARSGVSDAVYRQLRDAILAGKPAPAATMASTGALIAFPERGANHARLTYVKDVAPILEKNCVACHQEGGIGPMQLTSYEMVKGFSPMIREVIRTDRMPPYNASPHVGRFSDTKNLTPAEVNALGRRMSALGGARMPVPGGPLPGGRQMTVSQRQVRRR